MSESNSTAGGSPKAERLLVLLSAAGSVALLLVAGHRKHAPSVLQVLFTLWVLFPFLVFLVASSLAKHWATLTRVTLNAGIAVLCPVSLALYAVAVSGLRGPTVTRVFVIVPPASVLLMVAIIAIASMVGSRSG